MSQKQLAHKQAKQLCDDLYWIDGKGSNLFLCIEPDGLTLVDTGMPKRAALIFDVIKALGFRPSDLKQTVITHADIDHVGSLAEVQRRSGCAVFASHETAVYLQNGRSPKHLPWLLQTIIDRFYPFEPIDTGVLHLVADGDSLPIWGGLEAIATPGHTPDHYAFFSPIHGVMFTGDTLNTRKGPLHTSEDRVSANPLQVIQSAHRILNYAPAIIACGHGTPLTAHSSNQMMDFFNVLRQKEAKL